MPTQTTLYRARVTDSGCAPFYSDVKGAFFDGTRIIPVKLLKGRISLEVGLTSITDYKVMSEVESSIVNFDGSFEVLATDSTEEDVLLLLNEKAEVTMLGHYIGRQEQYVIDSRSSAMAMLVMYPFMNPISVSEKLELKARYSAKDEFEQLVRQVDLLSSNGIKSVFSNKQRNTSSH